MRTNSSAETLDQFLSAWTRGEDQTIYIAGPISTSSDSDFLLDIFNSTATVAGSPSSNLVLNASINNPGYFITQILQYAWNPLDVDIRQSDLLFSISAEPPLSIGFGLAPNTKVPGSYQWVQVIAIESEISLPAHSVVPIVIQPAPTNSLHVLFRPLASCCYLLGVKQDNFMTEEVTMDVYAEGTMKVWMEEFPVSLSFSQHNIPFTCKKPNFGKTWKDVCHDNGFFIDVSMCK